MLDLLFVKQYNLIVYVYWEKGNVLRNIEGDLE